MDLTRALTTPEAAQRLGLPIPDARVLLRSAAIEHRRIGGAYLWDRGGVHALMRMLRAGAVRRRRGGVG